LETDAARAALRAAVDAGFDFVHIILDASA
jgi:hypothetical protein